MKRNTKINIAYFLIVSVITWGIMAISYNRGWDRGANAACYSALDTITKIVRHQIDNDTSVSQIHIINPDTFRFYLSRKTIHIKNPTSSGR